MWLVAALALLGMPAGAKAGGSVLETTRFDDPPPDGCSLVDCSLREAVRVANETPGGGSIQLQAGTYRLTRSGEDDDAFAGDLDLTDPSSPGFTSITGAGPGLTKIDGTGTGRVFHLISGVAGISALTITGGTSSTDGAGILVNGTSPPPTPSPFLALSDVHLVGNDATTSSGGGLATHSNTTLTDVVMSGNIAGSGGALLASHSLTVTGSTISNNTSTGSGGGALFLSDRAITLVNSTISGNRAAETGGGIDTIADPLTLDNVTITGNIADTDANEGGGGGGIWVTAGPATIKNSVLAANTDQSPSLKSPDCDGPLVSNGHTLLGTNQECAYTAGPGDKIGTPATPIDPKLGPLTDNGGPTITHALAKDSPAIDAGGTDCEKEDQRGAPRTTCDMGAYERVLCGKVLVNIVGSSNSEKIVGTKSADSILALDRADVVNAKGGKDVICGGSGSDILRGGGGKDYLRGESGKDLCVGGPSSDRAKSCEQEKTV